MKFIRNHAKKIHATNKTDVYHFEEIWSSDILVLKDYGPENNRGYRYVLIVIHKISKCCWTVPLKKKSQTIKDSFKNILISSKIKPIFLKLIEVRSFITACLKNF